MNPLEIENAMFSYLEIGQEGEVQYKGKPVQVIFMNQISGKKENPPRVPRIEIDRTGNFTQTIGLSIDAVLTSNLVLTVITSSGSLTRVRNAILSDLYDKFPLHKEIGGAIITARPEIAAGYKDGNEYRTPVFIEFTAIIEG